MSRFPSPSPYTPRFGRPSQRGSALPLLGLFGSSLLALFVLGHITGWNEGLVWWLTNTSPPSIALTGPTGPVRGTVQLEAQLAPLGRANVVGLVVDGQSVSVTRPLMVDTSALSDGPHRVTVQAEDSSRLHNRADAELSLRSDNTPPHLNLELNSSVVEQGGTLLLKVRADEPSSTTALMDGRQLDLQTEADYGWAIAGFGPEAPLRPAAITVRGVDQAGNTGEQTATFQVAAHQFTQDRVQVSSRLASLLEPSVRAEEDAHLAPTYGRVSTPRLWSGQFRLPVQGLIVTQFGEVRSYNGGPFEGHHAGVDFAVNAGTPVLAPARGTVALVDQVALRGNVVILDHGLGVFTTYAHLSAVDTRPGETIQAGQAFAKVGTTGLSEGPHLHWELWIGGQNVDPIPWTQRAFP